MKPLIILEGPDGGGKSTLAAAMAERLKVPVTHAGPFKRVQNNLARLYVEMMAPALTGDRAVIMDRSWLSEHVYGDAFRGGEDRIGPVRRAMLDRIAARCLTTVVICRPTLKTCLNNWRARRGAEMLENEEQLTQVWTDYEVQNLRHYTTLPTAVYNYERPLWQSVDIIKTIVDTCNFTKPHLFQDVPSGGRIDAPIVLVGEGFAEHNDADSLYRVPFVSFQQSGCSWWLTHEVGAVAKESDIFWLNADFPPEALKLSIEKYPHKRVIALGEAADKVLNHLHVEHVNVPHPMWHKRFRYDERYPLLDELKRAA